MNTLLYAMGGESQDIFTSFTFNMVTEVELPETSSSDSEFFLGEVSANKHKPWKADIIVNQDRVTFELDSGTDVTVLPPTAYYKSISHVCAKPKRSSMVLADMG